MTDTGPGFRDPLDVVLVEPNAVAERHLRAEQAEAVDILHRRATAASTSVFLLVRRLQEVHVQRHAIFARGVGEPPERFVRAPVQVSRGELILTRLLLWCRP